MINLTVVLTGVTMLLGIQGAIKHLLLIVWEATTRSRFMLGEQLAEPVDKAVTLAEPVDIHTKLLVTFL